MKIRILIRQKIEGEVGTIAEVSPDRASFLLMAGAAEEVAPGEQAKPEEKAAKAPAKAAKKTATKKK